MSFLLPRADRAPRASVRMDGNVSVEAAGNGTQNPASRVPAGSSAGLFPRAVAFIALAVFVDLWLQHHLGWGIENPGLLGALATSAAAGAGLLDRLTGRDTSSVVWEAIRRPLGALVSRPVIVTMWLAAGVVLSSFSSIRVVLPDDAAGLPVLVGPVERSGEEGRERSCGEGSLRRCLVPVGLFGRPYRVKVEGYVRETVIVPPLLGATLRSDRDLRPIPSVLVRPGPEGLQALASKGSIRFVLESSSGRRDLDPIKQTAASFLIGRSRSIPMSLAAQWKMELEGRDDLGQPGAAAAVQQTLGRWIKPVRVDAGWELEPGMRLTAIVLAGNGTEVERGEVVLGDEPLVDLPLLVTPSQ